jgi:hypothetical protein
MMTLKQAVEIGIQMGMTTFTVKHFNYSGKLSEQTADTIFDFIKGYENCIPMTCFFGTFHSNSIPNKTYSRPELCHIIYRLENEKIPIE